VHRRFVLIYTAGLELPDVFNSSPDDADEEPPEEDEDAWDDARTSAEAEAISAALESDPDRLPIGVWMNNFNALEQHLGKRRNGYLKMFAPYDMNEKEPNHGNLADDICDVYADLRYGLVKWRRGEWQDAAYSWQMRFAGHTGDHVLWALHPLHLLAFDVDTGLGVAAAPEIPDP
jgi:hypothetical protein